MSDRRSRDKFKVALIFPYFTRGGGLPDYFPFWLKTCAHNRDVDFLIFSDAPLPSCGVPDNVFHQQMQFEDFTRRIYRILPTEVRISQPYKLCDCKPMYGAALEPELVGYDYWGFCDCDLLFGRLYDSLFPANADEGFERIFSRGHLSLFRNTEFNRWAWRDLPNEGCQSWLEALSETGPRCYDEWGEHVGGGMSLKYKRNNIAMDDRQAYADIKVNLYDFEVVREKYPEHSWEASEKNRVFYWHNGCLWGLSVSPSNSVTSTQYAYCHFQRRSLKVHGSADESDSLLLTPPNRLAVLSSPLDVGKLTPDDIVRLCGKYDRSWQIKTLYSRLIRKINSMNSE